MIELIATVVITASSILLFAYWFRYTCLLSAKTARDYTSAVAHSNSLLFPDVQMQLQQSASLDLDRLRDALDRDFKVVRNMLKHLPSTGEAQSVLETQMLAINYRLMRTWYQITRHVSGSTAAHALGEMSMVVAHFANLMGEQAASAAAA
jgi:hypothetical protein